jgi:phage terminase small subunit
MADRVPKVPDGLGQRGAAFWRDVWREYDLTDAERVLLVEVCATLDVIEALAAVVAAEGTVAEGSKGQTVVHPAVRELRAQRAALGRLLGQLELEDQDGRALPSPASLQARKAAAARWAS